MPQPLADPISPEALPQRFRMKLVVTSTGCWEWTAGTSPNGYGKFFADGAMQCAHRFAWSYFHGPVPAGLELDHLCRVRRCVNPAHLEPVTRKVNAERGLGPALASLRGRSRTHCANGHALVGDNVAQRTDHPGRRCRACTRDAGRRARNRRAAA